MRPFLFLGSRAEDLAADEEYASMLRASGLTRADLCRRRLEAGPLGPIDLEDYSGVIVGGGPFTISDPGETKTAVQLRVEAEMGALIRDVVAHDYPFLGCCYGLGGLVVETGGSVDRRFGEPVGTVAVDLTDEGHRDPLFATLPARFEAFIGHKEAVRVAPPGARVLASSATCPVQALVVGANVYATQFHPELDADAMTTRIDAYRDFGYFDPETAEAVKERCRVDDATASRALVAGFVARYRR